MTALFDVSLGTSEPENQEVTKAVLCACPIVLGIHGAQNVVTRNLPIKGRYQAGETLFAND
jgi:hypothetical protein